MMFNRTSQASTVALSSLSIGRGTMPASDSETLNSEDDQEKGYSAVSKSIGKFFGRRTEDLFIELEEPHKIYSPGEVVRGRVNLTLHTNIRTVYLKLIFYGQVRIGAGKNRLKTVLFQDTLVLWGRATEQLDTVTNSSRTSPEASTASISRSENTQASFPESIWTPATMQAGRHVFEFEFSFASKSMPSTVDFGRGCISYALRCEHRKPTTIVSRGLSVCRKNLTFLDTIDIGHLSTPLIRHIDHDSKRKESIPKIQASIAICRTGYLKGESITLTIHIQHIKAIKNMQGTIATLYRLSRFNSHEVAPQSFRKDLCQSISPLLVDPQSLKYRVSPRLRVPTDVFPTVKSAGPVSFRYFVEVILDLGSKSNARMSGASDRPSSYSNISATESSPMIETDALKRERGVHCVVFEVVIGTKSSGVHQQQNIGSEMPSNFIRRSETAISVTNETQAPGSTFEAVPVNRRTPEGSRISLSSLQTETHAEPLRHLESDPSFPLSKTALQELETALLPSLPPGAESDLPDDHFQDVIVPHMSALDLSSYEDTWANRHVHPHTVSDRRTADDIAQVVQSSHGHDPDSGATGVDIDQAVGVYDSEKSNSLPMYNRG